MVKKGQALRNPGAIGARSPQLPLWVSPVQLLAYSGVLWLAQG